VLPICSHDAKYSIRVTLLILTMTL
jgi:hypothetical protein